MFRVVSSEDPHTRRLSRRVCSTRARCRTSTDQSRGRGVMEPAPGARRLGSDVKSNLSHQSVSLPVICWNRVTVRVTRRPAQHVALFPSCLFWIVICVAVSQTTVFLEFAVFLFLFYDSEGKPSVFTITTLYFNDKRTVQFLS